LLSASLAVVAGLADVASLGRPPARHGPGPRLPL